MLRLTFSIVHRIMQIAVVRGMERREVTGVKHISIDEKAIAKGHHYATIVMDADKNIILAITEERTKESCKQALDMTFNDEQKKEIETASTDMWDAYANTCKEELANAKVCYDKFHLIKYLNQAVDQVRRQEAKTQEELKNTKYIWLKDKINLTEKQRITFEAINETNYQTAKAYRIKENFRAIAFGNTFANPLQLFGNWYRDAINSQLQPIIKVAQMFYSHTQGILNAITTGKNNARMERMNGNLQMIKVIGRGYSSFIGFAMAAYFFFGGLDLSTR